MPNQVPTSSRIALALIAAGLHAGALAQQDPDLNALPIEQLLNLEVRTTSKIPQRISEAPSSVSVITAEDIRLHGYRTLADILQSVPGVQITYDRNYSYASVRGLGSPGDLNTRLLILIDGRRLNDIVYDQGALGTEFPIDMELVERVEFVPGPGSAIYGSSAFLGVLNVITKAGTTSGVLASAALASGGGREARVVASSKGAGGMALLVGASWYDSTGRDLYFPEFDDAVSHGIASRLDYDRYHRAFAKLSAGDLVLEAYLGRRTKGVPTASYGQQFNDPRSLTIDDYEGASLSWQRSLSDTLEVFGSADVTRYRYSGTYVYAPDSPSPNIDAAQSRSGGAELRVLSTGLSGHRLIAGLEYVRDGRREMINYDINPLVLNLDVDKPKRRAAIYVQDEMRLGERWILNTGLRHDDDTEGGHSTNPRVALLYKTTPQMTLKALYGTAYRSANAYERYYTTGINDKLNPKLRSEHIRTCELIAEYFPTDRFRASASAFQYRLRDLVALATDPLDGRLVFANIDAARATGVELDMQWLRADGSALKGSASVQSAHNDATGQWLGNSPRRLFKLDYTTPLPGDRVRASVAWRVTSRRRTDIDGVAGAVGGFGLVDLALLGRSKEERLEWSARLVNLLGKRHADVPSEEHYDDSDPPRHLRAIGQDGRGWRVTATLRF